MTDQNWNDYLRDLRAELAQALGEAIWAFAMIERQTYEYMRALSSEPLHELMGGQMFGARMTLIKKLVNRLEGQDDDKAWALKYIDKAESLVRRRNTIVHNPWQIWIDFESNSFKSGIKKQTDEAATIDLKAMREFTAEAREAASGFEYALTQLRTRSHHARSE